MSDCTESCSPLVFFIGVKNINLQIKNIKKHVFYTFIKTFFKNIKTSKLL